MLKRTVFTCILLIALLVVLVMFNTEKRSSLPASDDVSNTKY